MQCTPEEVKDGAAGREKGPGYCSCISLHLHLASRLEEEEHGAVVYHASYMQEVAVDTCHCRWSELIDDLAGGNTPSEYYYEKR